MIPLRDRLPTRQFPIVNYALLALNVISFLWELASIEAGYAEFVQDWGFVPARFLANPTADAITIRHPAAIPGKKVQAAWRRFRAGEPAEADPTAGVHI